MPAHTRENGEEFLGERGGEGEDGYAEDGAGEVECCGERGGCVGEDIAGDGEGDEPEEYADCVV